MFTIWVILKWKESCCPQHTIMGGYTTQDLAESAVQSYAYWEPDFGIYGEWVSTQQENVWYTIEEVHVNA